MLDLAQVADELTRLLVTLSLPSADGVAPALAPAPRAATGRWKGHRLFHEFFHGDSGEGLGASHRTGWTALVAELLRTSAASR